MGCKLAMFLGLSALLMVLMVDQAESVCCHATERCFGGWWNRKCNHYCKDGTRQHTPCCGYGRCNIFCCNCDGGCRRSKREVAKEYALPGRGLGDNDVDNDMARVEEEARGLLELLHEEQDEYAMHRRVFGEHDVDKDTKLSKEEALEMLKKMGTDVSELPADWFETLDTNGNGYIDPEEFDEDMAKTLK
ncbi:uncharacterized protein [Branchiostoma lanceolatum]|uniref:uncharacterized protein n=1 Tax=Branchiostoma lanceolatum TaxID=7740 RepID=UPI003453C936